MEGRHLPVALRSHRQQVSHAMRPAMRELRRLERVSGASLARWYALVFGAIYLLTGIYRLLLDGPSWSERTVMPWFNGGMQINLLHELVHIAIGTLGLAAFYRHRELVYCRAMALIFAVLSVAGFLNQPTFGLIWLGGTDLFLHGMTAILGEAVSRVASERELEAVEREVGEMEDQTSRGQVPAGDGGA
ncbi:MAG TPA: DUF4383 domain-containing protein [Dehalococcoidia bacterium]|nr:DUF4383 domain-containing protein [Dehalococcoidia bacterium]